MIACRLAAGAIALVAMAGFTAGFVAVFGRTGSLAAAAAVMLSYFTNITALLVAGLFLATLVRPARWLSSRLLAAAALTVVLVGVVQFLLLSGTKVLRGGDAVADLLLHVVLPLAVPFYWLACGVKGRLRFRDPLVWTLYPLAYLAFALVRGEATGRYAYPFIDVARTGWHMVTAHAVAITVAFIVTGFGLVALDGFLARRKDRA
jgi:hypothetical protein